MNALRERRLGAWAWLLAVQFFIAQWIVASAWTTSFQLSERFISDLGNTACAPYPPGSVTIVCSPWHPAMNASFIVVGLTMTAGAFLARDAFEPGLRRALAIVLFALAGLGVVVVGIYPENESHGWHTAGAGLNFVAGNAALILFASTLHRPVRQTLMAWLGFVAGTVGLLATILFVHGEYLGLGPGGMERLVAYPIPGWQVVMGLWLLRVATPTPKP